LISRFVELRTTPIYYQLCVGGCTALEHLDISENVLVSLPKLGSLTALQSLRVSHNSLKSLPPDIANLSSLYSMEISNNDLESLPCGDY